MNILYLTYSKQSGVVDSVSKQLRDFGHTIMVMNVAEKLNFRYNKVKFPKLSIFNLINSYKSISKFKQKWKYGYLRTDYAFDYMSNTANNLLQRESNTDIVLQSGLLFSTETGDIPYFIGILDNTYLIGRKGRRRPVGLILSDRFIEKEKEAYNRATKIFVMSNHVKLSLIEDYDVSEDKVIVTGVGANIVPDGTLIVNEKKYFSKKIIFIALDFKRKGGYELLDAFSNFRLENCI